KQAEDLALEDLEVEGAQGDLLLPAPEVAVDLGEITRLDDYLLGHGVPGMGGQKLKSGLRITPAANASTQNIRRESALAIRATTARGGRQPDEEWEPSWASRPPLAKDRPTLAGSVNPESHASRRRRRATGWAGSGSCRTSSRNPRRSS